MNHQRSFEFQGEFRLHVESGILRAARFITGEPPVKSAFTDVGRRVFFKQRAEALDFITRDSGKFHRVEPEARSRRRAPFFKERRRRVPFLRGAEHDDGLITADKERVTYGERFRQACDMYMKIKHGRKNNDFFADLLF